MAKKVLGDNNLVKVVIAPRRKKPNNTPESAEKASRHNGWLFICQPGEKH